MERWAILLDDATHSRLSDEQLQLGRLEKSASDESLLVFRDRFVALKIASSVGAQRPIALPPDPRTGTF